MRPGRLGRRPSRLGAARQAPQGDGRQTIVPAARFAPGACENVGWVSCERGVTHHAERWVSLRSTHPTKRNDDQEKRKRNADRRVQPTSASRDAARTGGCARLSAFHYGSYHQGFRPLGATPGQASWDAAGRSIRYGRSNRGAKISRSYTGVTRARLSQSRERTSRTGRSAGQHDARSCPGAECIVPRAGTALAPPLGIPSRQASLVSEILWIIYLK